MTVKTDSSSNGFQQLFADVKEYVNLQSDYLQVGLVEKLTKLLSKLMIALIAFVFIIGTLFYLLFAVAYALAPGIGFVASFAIIGVFFIVLLLFPNLYQEPSICLKLLRLQLHLTGLLKFHRYFS